MAGLTPTKTRSKPVQPMQTDYTQVDQMRLKWIALLPTEMAPLIEQSETQAHQATSPETKRAWHVAGAARQFMEWVHFNPAHWTPFGGYNERLARVCAWLSQQPKTELPNRREDALKILLSSYEKYLEAIADDVLLYDTIPTLWFPDDEFGPLNMPLPYLPLWHINITPQHAADLGPERVQQRWETARVAEEFTVYAGLVTYLNTAIGLQLLDLDPNPF